jgi:hypothetical protein
VRDDLGVGLGYELVALFGQLLLERKIILDDAIVDHDDVSGAVAVRVGVLFSRAAVRGPARVSDAVSAIERLEPDGFFEVSQLALGAADLQALAVAGDRDAGGVVSAILQPLQPLDDDRHDLLISNVSDDAAHSLVVSTQYAVHRCSLLLSSRAKRGTPTIFFALKDQFGYKGSLTR